MGCETKEEKKMGKGRDRKQRDRANTPDRMKTGKEGVRWRRRERQGYGGAGRGEQKVKKLREGERETVGGVDEGSGEEREAKKSRS
eukprot:6179937-Pleurochrysis_carterae.AAC.1